MAASRRTRTVGPHVRTPRRCWTIALLVAVALVAAVPAGASPDAPPQTNTTYQPTNAEWLARGNEGQQPVGALLGGPSNPSGSLTRTPEGDVAVGQAVTFDASASTARRNDHYGGTQIVNWVWDLGDGTQANAPVVTHRYTEPGVYHVSLVVHDDTGWRSSRTNTVVVGDAPCGQEPAEIWIPTRDGDRLHGYLTIPSGPGPFPVILEYGPYAGFPRGACDDTVRNGYAFAHVAAPGRAKSTGEWDMFGTTTQRAGYDAVEWLAAQPWSNGNVGMWGLSGPACAALLVAGASPPHLRAVVAKTAYSDMYRDIITAGGVPNSDTFVNAWLPLLTAQDAGTYGNTLGPNGEVVDHGITNTERQIDLATRTTYDAWWQERAITSYPTPEAAVLYYGNQRDLWPRSTVELQRWIAPSGGRVISVPGGHGFPDYSGWAASPNAGDYLAGDARLWFDRHLKGERNGVDRRPAALTFSGFGGDVASIFNFGVWEQLDGFPSSASQPLQLHLRSAGSNPQRPHFHGLSAEPAADGEAPSPLPYSPVQGATSDDTAATLPQTAGLQESWESHSLVYETPALSEDVHVNGPATLTFHARILAPDMAFTVHVNDVWPDGSSHYVSKGALLASHRELDTERSLYLDGEDGKPVLIRAYHPHTAEAVQTLVPGQVYRFDVEVWGIHNVFKAGHRLRLSLAAQDLGWRTHAEPGFAAIVHNDQARPSTLNLAVLDAADSTNPFPYR